MGQCE